MAEHPGLCYTYEIPLKNNKNPQGRFGNVAAMIARRLPTGTSARARRARLAGLLLAIASGIAAATEPLTLAVVPQWPPAVVHRQWAPVAERLSTAGGIPIRVRIYSSFPAFESDVRRGIPDLVFLNPYQQLVAHQTQGYIPLVRNGARPLTGVLVVRHDSPVRTLDDLNDTDIAFPHPTAFAASLYMRALLHDKEKIRFRAHYLSTHGNVYRHVILGRVTAGGGVNMTLERELPQTRQALRVLYVTPPTPSHPLSAHPRIPLAQREALVRALLALREDEDGRARLKRIDLGEPVRADQRRDYQPLERLQLERYASELTPEPP